MEMQVQGGIGHESISKMPGKQCGREQSLTKKSVSHLRKSSKTSLTQVESVIEEQEIEPKNSLAR